MVHLKMALGLTDDQVAEALAERARRIRSKMGPIMFGTKGMTAEGIARKATEVSVMPGTRACRPKAHRARPPRLAERYDGSLLAAYAKALPRRHCAAFGCCPLIFCVWGLRAMKPQQRRPRSPYHPLSALPITLLLLVPSQRSPRAIRPRSTAVLDLLGTPLATLHCHHRGRSSPLPCAFDQLSPALSLFVAEGALLQAPLSVRPPGERQLGTTQAMSLRTHTRIRPLSTSAPMMAM